MTDHNETEPRKDNPKDNPKAPEIDPPKGFMPPEHEGDEWESVTTFRTKPDGKICILKIGDHKYEPPDYSEEKEKQTKPSYKPMAREIVGAMDNEPGY